MASGGEEPSREPEPASGRRGAVEEEIRRALLTDESLLPASLAERFGLPIEEVKAAIRRLEGESEAFRIGRYEVLEEIGRGAMGVVFRARDTELGRIVALKILAPSLTPNEKAVERFRREAKAAARIVHPSLVRIYEIGEQRGTWYLSMDLVSGSSLRDDIAARQEKGRTSIVREGREELQTFLLRFAGVVDALHLVHQRGVFHRDVKPSNILVSEDGTLKLVDFGLAKEQDAAALTMSGAMMGTPHYMSPEQFLGQWSRVDARSDVYSLGVTLYEVLTLHKPFEGDTLSDLGDRIVREDPPSPRRLGLRLPKDLEAIVFKAIEKQRRRRYQSAAELAEDLRNFVNYLPVSAKPRGPIARLRRKVRRNRRALLAGLGVVLIALSILLAPHAYSAADTWLSRRAATRIRETREREASNLLERARRVHRAPSGGREGAALPLLENLLGEYAETAVAPEASRLMGTWLMEGHEREEAQEHWVRAFVMDPLGETGRSALLDLARSFFEEGSIPSAEKALSPILGSSTGVRRRSRARLLAAEIALARGEPGKAAGHLERCRAAELCETEKSVLARLRAVLGDLHPFRDFPVGPVDRLIAGRLLGDAACVLTLQDGRLHLFESTEGGLGELALEGWDQELRNVQWARGDLDGEGPEELVLITVWDDARQIDLLRVLSFERREGPDGPFCATRERFRLELPRGTHLPSIGDVDGDGRPEILVGHTHPAEGVTILRNRGRCEFDPSFPLGEIEKLGTGREDEVDIQGLSVADLRGDGKSEILVAAGPHGLHHLLIYRFVDGELKLAFQAKPAFVVGFPVLDLDRDGREEAYFGTATRFHGLPQSALDGFLPQGLYRVAYEPDAADDGYRTEALSVFRRLRTDSRNLGIDVVLDGRRDGLGTFLATRARFGVGNDPDAFQLRIYPDCAHPGPGICIATSSDSRPLGITDLDGDGEDEVLLGTPSGIRVFGLGGRVEPVVSGMPEAPPFAKKEGSALRLEVARHLLEMGLYSTAESEFGGIALDEGDTRTGRLASLGLVDAHAFQEEYDRSLAILDRLVGRHRGEARRLDLWRAHYTERSWQLDKAARLFTRLGELGGLSFTEQRWAARMQRALNPWLSLQTAPIPPPSEWVPSEPGRFRLDGSNGILALDPSGGYGKLWLPYVWRGDSFQLSFDLRIDQLEPGRALCVGFVEDHYDDVVPQGLSIEFESTDTLRHNVRVAWAGPERPAPDGGELQEAKGKSPVSAPGENLSLGRWYRCQLTYDRGRALAGIVVRPREEDRPWDAIVRLEDVQCRPEDRLRLTVGFKGQRDFPVPAAFVLRNLRLSYLRDEISEFPRKPPAPEIEELGRAHRLLMCGREEDALAGYLDFLDSSPGADAAQRSRALLTAGLIEWRRSGGEAGVEKIREAARLAGRPCAEILEEQPLLLEGERPEALLQSLRGE